MFYHNAIENATRLYSTTELRAQSQAEYKKCEFLNSPLLFS